MAKLTFYGAVGTVTGSRFLLEVDGTTLLIDCGLFQGRKENRLRNWEPFPIPPKKIDQVFLTHAHIDHTGYLPRLCKQGFTGPVYCTHATHHLAKIMLPDSAHLQEEDARWANKRGYSKHKPALPLYTIRDAERALEQFQPVNYGHEFYLDGSNVRIKFKDAGHILGSSFIEFKRENGENSKKILFTGDFGRPSQAVMKDPTQVFNIDYLILESTYGARLHEYGHPREELARVVRESYERRGVLVIPSFSVGRTQTLLYVLRELEEEGKIPTTQVYIDSPMAINATKVFEDRLADFNLETRREVMEGKQVFHPKQLHVAMSREESQAINKVDSEAIIISASGMVTGGRILHHLRYRLPDEKNTVLFIGYQAEGTRGRTILNGSETVKIHGEQVPIRAKVENISGFSGHADYNEILAYLMGVNRPPDAVFMVHGDGDASLAMAEKIRTTFNWNVQIPELGQMFDLDF